MDNLPTLSEEEIEDWTDSRSFQRGKSYYRSGAIRNPQVQGDRLLAECSGSAAMPYRLEIILDEEGIASGHCSCPVGTGGHCKHCVALLLTWLHAPDSFIPQEPVAVSLANRSREELIALIEQMTARYPDLSTLLEMPIAGVSRATAQLDPAVVRRQVNTVLENMYYEDDWYGGYAGANQLYSIAGQGDDYLEAEEWANAATVYINLAAEVIEEYEQLYDDEGEVVSVVDDCAQGLGYCLKHAEDVALRAQIIDSLLAIFLWDVEEGGIGGGESATDGLLSLTTAEERAEIAARLRAILESEPGSSPSGWRAQRIGGLLLQLETETLSDEEYLRICRETGRTEDLVHRLLRLDRSREAADAVRETEGHRFLALSRIIYGAGHTQLAEQLVREHLEQTDLRNVSNMLQQLIEWASARQSPAEALSLALRLLASVESLAAYQQTRQIAEPMGVWPETREEILDKLEKKGSFVLLTQIFVDEERVDDALDALKRSEERRNRSTYQWHHPYLRLSVAQLAETERPDAAIAIYHAEAVNQINGRKRDTYAVAAGHLARIKGIYSRREQMHAWNELIAQIRQEYKRLPALQDELKKAGL